MRRQTLTVQTTAAAEMAAVYPEPGDYRMEALTLLPEHRPADTQKDKAALELQMTVEAVAQATYLVWLDAQRPREDIIAKMPLCRPEPGMVTDTRKSFCIGRRMTQTVIIN